MIRTSLLTRLSQQRTSQQSAWRGGKFETYRLNFAIPAVRLHEKGTPRGGAWYAVDEYNLTVPAYHRRYALLKKLERPQLEIFVLAAGTIVNVGMARRQGSFRGGGLQFEILPGSPKPQAVEHISDPNRVRF